jgi:hypothetical protein
MYVSAQFSAARFAIAYSCGESCGHELTACDFVRVSRISCNWRHERFPASVPSGSVKLGLAVYRGRYILL